MNEQDFMTMVIEDVTKEGMDILISGAEGVIYEGETTKCNGYFDANIKKLAISTGKDKSLWFPVFVHEYCHFLQFTTDYPGFLDNEKEGEAFWSMVEGESDIDMKSVRKGKEALQDLEWDCEKRVLTLIDALELPLDPVTYAKKANAYTYFYDVVLAHGRWYELGREPYNNQAILDRMPGELDYNYKNVCHTTLDFMAEECFGEITS